MSTVDKAEARFAAALARLEKAVIAQAEGGASKGETVALEARARDAEGEVERLRQVNAAIAAKLDATADRVAGLIGDPPAAEAQAR